MAGLFEGGWAGVPLGLPKAPPRRIAFHYPAGSAATQGLCLLGGRAVAEALGPRARALGEDLRLPRVVADVVVDGDGRGCSGQLVEQPMGEGAPPRWCAPDGHLNPALAVPGKLMLRPG